jgi:thiol-disulfide isomerase/thioredoxin
MGSDHARRALMIGTLLLSTLALPAPAQQGPQLRQQIAATLVRPGPGYMQAFHWQHVPDIIVLYFGADWCSACHRLTPELLRVRNALRAAGADTEVVFVSQDHSEAQLRRYMHAQAMPWPALDYHRIEHIQALRRLAGMAPPNLVLLGGNGQVLANGWDGRRYRGTAAVMHCWLQVAAPHPTNQLLAASSAHDATCSAPTE